MTPDSAGKNESMVNLWRLSTDAAMHAARQK